MAVDRVAIGSFLYNCLLMATFALTNTILPVYANEIGASVTAIGQIWTISYLAGFIAAFLWGSVSDRSKKRAPYIIFGNAIQSLVAILQTFTQNIFHLATVMIVGNLLGSGVYPIFMTLISEESEAHKRGRSMAFFYVGGSAGYALSVLSAGFITEHYGAKTIFYISAFLLVVALLVVRIFLWTVSKNEEYPAERQVGFWSAIRDLKLLGSAFVLFCLASICCYISDVVKTSYVFLFFTQEMFFSQTFASFVLSLGVWAEIPSHLLFGPLSDRLGRKPPVLVGLFAVFLSNVLMSVSQNSFQAELTMLLYGVAYGSFASASTAFIADLVDERNRAKAMSLYSSTRALASIIAPATMSLAILETNFRTAFVVIATICMAGFLLVLFSVQETQQTEFIKEPKLSFSS